MKRKLNLNFRLLSATLVVIFSLFVSTGGAVLALSPGQQTIFNEGIYYFDLLSNCDNSGSGGSNITLTGSDNLQKAFNFFTSPSIGLTAAQAAGVLANLYNESGINPTSGAPIRNGTGFGIAQWTFTSRQSDLQKFADSLHLPVTDLLAQLQFIWHELNTDYKSVLTGLKQITGNDASAAGQAAVYFRDNYEACDISVNSCSDRQSVGVKMYKLVGGSAPATSPGSTGSDGCSSSGSGASPVSGNFTNPFPDGWQPSRLDMGYDGTFKGKIVAPFTGVITYASNSFSNWGGYMELKSVQPLSGLPTTTLYFAEGITPIVSSGHVMVGEPIANAAINHFNQVDGNIEWGVAADGSSVTDPYAEAALGGGSNCHYTSESRSMVLNFYKWAQQTLHVPGQATNESCAGGA